ncbi:single-stranded DNA-binding protein [Corynebacterium sp. H127]|uniref:single-stranded DNA-binding protein n=1 Tax=Corynebacterium sp. H127 TaxID=3133418 RepID=UPI0030AEA210
MAQHSVTITGNIITTPTLKKLDNTAVYKMRIAASRAVKDEKDEWQNFDQLYISVECWNQLAVNCNDSLFKGMAVMVTGTLLTHEWVDAENKNQSRIVLRASHVGVDLTRHAVRPGVFTPLNPPAATEQPATVTDAQEQGNQETELAGVGASAGEEEVPF